MEPNYQNPGYSPAQTRALLLLKVAAVAIVFIILIVIATMVLQSRKFHVVRTEPDMNNVAAIAPFIKLDFNKPIKTPKTGSITGNPDIVQSFSANGKVLTIDLSAGLQVGQAYSIVLSSVTSTNGETIRNKTFNFTAKDISYADLPADQQQAILKSQQQTPQTRNSYSYNNIEALTQDGGLTMYQADDVKQALFQYFQANKLKISDVDFSNFVPPVPHPNDPLGPDISYVDISLNGQYYKAKLSSSSLKTLRLYLYDINNNQVYDSKDIDTYDNNY